MSISVENLNFKYKDKVIFENLNLKIKKNKITSIIGPNGSGKSTLVKIILGILNFEGTVTVEQYHVKENIREIRKNIGVVFENPDNQFIAETVFEDIAFTLENMKDSKKNIKEKVLEIAEYLNITDILKFNPRNLNNSQKQLVALASALVHQPRILILDEALTYVDPIIKDRILEILKELNENGMTIINITNDIEETLISDEIIVINKKIVLNGSKEKIYKEEKILNDLGFKLPFMVELSNRLKFYDLIDHVVYDMKEMVDLLWK